MFIFHVINKFIRITLGCLVFIISSSIFLVVCTLLLPWRQLRIKSCNFYGIYMGKTMLFLLQANAVIHDKERLLDYSPAIYMGNHTSTLDIFLGISICPVGGVGISKKEIAYIPFFGWLYLLSGHLLIDRKNREAAIKSMDNIVRVVKKHNLSIWIWPEGTRSKDGRLQPLKKGFVHLAINTKLPIVPVVIHNAHKKWGKENGLCLTPGSVQVNVLPKIDTSDWKVETINEHVDLVHGIFTSALTEEQKPNPVSKN